MSFDAISPDLFADRRVGTTIGRVIDNVYNFVKLRNSKYPHVQIRISMGMYKENKWLEQFEGFKVMWRDLGARCWLRDGRQWVLHRPSLSSPELPGT